VILPRNNIQSEPKKWPIFGLENPRESLLNAYKSPSTLVFANACTMTKFLLIVTGALLSACAVSAQAGEYGQVKLHEPALL